MVLNAAVKKNFTAVFSKTNFLYQDYDSVPVILKYDKSVRHFGIKVLFYKIPRLFFILSLNYSHGSTHIVF